MITCMIIVNYNDYKSTKHLIDNVIDYDTISEILIVDNNSDSEELEKIKSIKHKKVNLIVNDENLGYGAAINVGAQYFIKKYKKCNLIISNSDIVILSEDDIKSLIEYLDYEKIGLVGPQIIERGQINRGEKIPRPFGDLLRNSETLNKFITYDKYKYSDDYYENDYSIVDSISSSFFLISSETLKKINFMDDNVFLYYEDYILSKKVIKLDLMVVVVNKVKVKHMYSISVDKNINNYRKTKMFIDSQIYFHTVYNKCNKFEKILLKIHGKRKTITSKVNTKRT